VISLQDLLLDPKGRKDAGIIGFRNETTNELIRGDCGEVYDRLLIENPAFLLVTRRHFVVTLGLSLFVIKSVIS
jgi:hypothetical protein